MSSKRSTHTTNTFVSGPRGGKDFPVDDLFAFTKGLNYMKHSEWIKHHIWHHDHCCHCTFQIRPYTVCQTLLFLQTPGFQNGWETVPVWDCVVWVNQAWGLHCGRPPPWCHCPLKTLLRDNIRSLSTITPSVGFHHIKHLSVHSEGSKCWPELSVKDGTTKAISVRASA